MIAIKEILKDNNLIYEPLNLLCVKESQKQKILEDIYNDYNLSLGAGIKSLYAKIVTIVAGLLIYLLSHFITR